MNEKSAPLQEAQEGEAQECELCSTVEEVKDSLENERVPLQGTVEAKAIKENDVLL